VRRVLAIFGPALVPFDLQDRIPQRLCPESTSTLQPPAPRTSPGYLTRPTPPLLDLPTRPWHMSTTRATLTIQTTETSQSYILQRNPLGVQLLRSHCTFRRRRRRARGTRRLRLETPPVRPAPHSNRSPVYFASPFARDVISTVVPYLLPLL